MANEPLQPKSAAPEATTPVGANTTLNLRAGHDKVVVYQHSNLFYWWPVWAVGFLFAAITYVGDYHMAIVPVGTEATSVNVQGVDHDALVLKTGKKHLTRKDAAGVEQVAPPTIYVSRYRSLGTIFLFVLLLVIFITNITLRGQWSLVVIVVLASVIVIFWLADFWDKIFEKVGNLSIYINLGGYLLISLAIFSLWLLNLLVFDKQLYMVFTPGQVRLCLEIGSGEMIYDSFGMTVQKQRSDLFRHVILGFGSGDLILRFSRIDHPIELHNVLNVKNVLRRIEHLTKEKIVVTDRDKEAPDAAKSPPKA